MLSQSTHAARCAALPTSTFSFASERIAAAQRQGTLVPLHIGDTYLGVDEILASADLSSPELHRYVEVPGLPRLRERVAREVASWIHYPAVRQEDIVISAGATGGLSLVIAALCDVGHEVVVITPSWPLIFGIVASHDGRVVEVPIAYDGWPADADAFEARLRSAVGKRTAAIYLSDPNNPAGYVLPQDHRQAIARVANQYGLWLVHDAVYGQLSWGAAEPQGFATLVDPTRLVTVGSFSKAYGLAGHRVGFVIAPALSGILARLLTFQCYHPSVVGQALALAALDHPSLLSRVRDSYAQGAQLATEVLDPAHTPEAGGFLLLDLRGASAPAQEILVRCLDENVALAPGASFGRDFASFARLCYTSVPPAALKPALHVVREATR